MMRIFDKRTLTLGLAALLAASAVQAQEVASGIFGYQNLTLLGNSDTIVALPFARLPAATVSASSFSGSVITVQGTPGWTASQFVYASGTQSNTYYVRIESGALEGKYFDITANSTNTVTVNLGSDVLTGLAANDQVSVIAYWTFGVVFANGNGIHPSISSLSRKTEVFIPNFSGVGKNLSSTATYYYFSNTTDTTTAWRKTTTGTTNLNDDIIQPNTYLTIRHNVATNTTFTAFGDVILTKITFPLRGNTTNQQDNALGLTRPVPVSLNDTGLTNGAFAVTISALSRKDELYVFDNTTTNKNRSSAATYYYLSNSGWRKTTGSSSIDYGTSNIFTPGAGFYIRRATTTNVAPYWINPAPYTNL
jgi:uncharacterized protein (TIGR02597 family)